MQKFESIKERNKWFNSLGRKEKRVEIARDVLRSIKSKLFHPSEGYLSLNTVHSDIRKSLQENMIDRRVKCYGCAIAAMFSSRVHLGNKWNLPSKDSFHFDVSGKEIRQQLNDIFPERQLRLIETTYERDSAYFLSNEDMESLIAETIRDANSVRMAKDKDKILVVRAVNYGISLYWRYDFDRGKVLQAICKNIIRNKGDFTIPKYIK